MSNGTNYPPTGGSGPADDQLPPQHAAVLVPPAVPNEWVLNPPIRVPLHGRAPTWTRPSLPPHPWRYSR